MTDLADELRIIAQDGGRLDLIDRARIAEAANKFEQTQRLLIATQKTLMELNASYIAKIERLQETIRKAESPQPFVPLQLSLSSGWQLMRPGASLWEHLK